MPVKVEGLETIVKAIRKVSPEVYKEMNKAIKPELKFLVAASREKIPTNFVGLSNWNSNPKPHGKFPEYDPTMMKSSYKYSIGGHRKLGSGWVNRYSIYTTNAAAAIVEFAGTVNPDGRPWVGPKGTAGKRFSHSPNPDAGVHFIKAINALRKAVKIGTTAGRIMYEAVFENNGRAKKATVAAIETALEKIGFTK